MSGAAVSVAARGMPRLWGGPPTLYAAAWTNSRLTARGRLLVLLAAAGAGCGPAAEGPATPGERPDIVLSAEARRSALARAAVWRPPSVPLEEVDLGRDPGWPGALPDDLVCEGVPRRTSGLTPKAHCLLPGGELVKIKYGADNPEVYADVAAARLLAALGFGADEMHVVRRLHCRGCSPPDAGAWIRRLFLRHRDVVFEDVAVERRFPGAEIVTETDEGWTWFEMDEARRRPGAAGASAAEWDALRVMAVLLAHWDNKAENQRLVCLPGGEGDGACARPFAFVQDLGASFGPDKVDLERWRDYPVFTDPTTCTVSMGPLPFAGGTFGETQIGEEGRRFLADRLSRLRPRQMRALFAGARFPDFRSHSGAGRDPGAWAAALQDKVRQVVEAGPCPAAGAGHRPATSPRASRSSSLSPEDGRRATRGRRLPLGQEGRAPRGEREGASPDLPPDMAQGQ